MAQTPITHACGHEQPHQLHGPHKERVSRREWLETTLCSECYEAKRQQERAETDAQAIAHNRDADLPPLIGSQAQIRWAETLRAQAVQSLLQRLEDGLPWLLRGAKNTEARLNALKASGLPWSQAQADAVVHAIRPLIYEWAATQTACRWWIDVGAQDMRREETCARFLGERVLAIMEAIAKGENPAHAEARLLAEQEIARQETAAAERQAAQQREQARMEALLIAPNAASPIVAEFWVQDGRVTILFPERNETVYQTLRGLDFAWKDRQWERTGADASERAVEAAHRLLHKGVSVRLYNPELRRRALAGDYAPVQTRRVSKFVTGKYAGWFALSWGRGEDYYAAAKRLHGARYAKPSVAVPAEAYADVQDFAALYGFALSVGAQGLIDAQKAAREQSVAVPLAPLPSETAPALPPAGPPPALPVPDAVEIAPSLREDAEDGDAA